MVRDLLCEIVGEAWVDLIDFASAEKVDASFVSKKRKKRESDVIWKLRRRDTGEPVYVYLLLEFQSRPDRFMAVRLMTYVGLFYESLIRQKKLLPSGLLPQVIPMVLYNGLAAWDPAMNVAELIECFHPSARPYIPHVPFKLIYEGKLPLEKLAETESPVADLFRLERSSNWGELATEVSRLKRHVGPEDAALREDFESWFVAVILPRLGVSAQEVPRGLTLEEFESMLAERIDTWNRQLLHEGQRQGLEQGLQQGLQKGLQKGLQQGLRQGLLRGQAETLLRLLKARFGRIDAATRKRIASAEGDLLAHWVDRSARAESLGDVFRD
jgi:Putative transposase, YhgA-like